MRIVKSLFLISVLFFVVGCSCKVRGVGANVPVAGDGGPLNDINFAFDSAELDSVAKAKLDENAVWLNENTSYTAVVEGHCDERGTNEYNMALGSRRAQSAYDYLVAVGVESSRLSTVSYGEELPLDPGHNNEAWRKNRRVHFDVK